MLSDVIVKVDAPSFFLSIWPLTLGHQVFDPSCKSSCCLAWALLCTAKVQAPVYSVCLCYLEALLEGFEDLIQIVCTYWVLDTCIPLLHPLSAKLLKNVKVPLVLWNLHAIQHKLHGLFEDLKLHPHIIGLLVEVWQL